MTKPATAQYSNLNRGGNGVIKRGHTGLPWDGRDDPREGRSTVETRATSAAKGKPTPAEVWRRRDGITTIYHIAVVDNHRRHGIGGLLVAALGDGPIHLKCKHDNPANYFYQALGFEAGGIEGDLNIWQRGGGL